MVAVVLRAGFDRSGFVTGRRDGGQTAGTFAGAFASQRTVARPGSSDTEALRTPDTP